MLLRPGGETVRLNVYSQELITDAPGPGERVTTGGLPLNVAEGLQQKADTGVIYSAVRMFLHSSDRLHARLGDDDRSAITFWLPKSRRRREVLARTFEALARLVREAPAETGLD